MNKNFESFSQLNEQLNYGYRQPSENELGTSLIMLAQLATQADISYRAANEVKNQILLVPSSYNSNYSNQKNVQLEAAVEALMTDKDLARTNRLNPIKMN